MTAIPFPQIDPVIFSIGPFSFHWYAIAYVLGILLGFLYLKSLNRYKPVIFSDNSLEDIILYAILGIILGGRIGYILFYKIDLFVEDPISIFKIWQGGMSFHGGMLGLTLSIYLLAKKHKLNFLRAIDLITCVAPIGLFLGRIANFINAELYGRKTNLPWGVIFPGTDGLPRHPSQLYEAAFEGVVLFIIMNLLIRIKNTRSKPGKLGGIFLLSYGLIRLNVEFFRQPDHHLGFYLDSFTMGQLLSLPMILVGLYFILRNTKHIK